MSTIGVANWSQSAASNANSDSSINWAEGMPPAGVNDSSRAEMASIARWRDDLNGTITTTGTSTAYTVSTNQDGSTSPGFMVAFVPHVTNGATVTLNGKPLRSAPGVELSSGVLVQGTPYAATLYSTNGGEWILHGFYGNPYNVPVGGGMIYLGTTAPNSSFAFPYGQALSRTTYAVLFNQIGTAFGAGDGSTTFNFIDLRGRVVVGKDDMGGTAANRVTTAGSGIAGATMGATGGEEAHTLVTAEIPAHSHGVTDIGHSHDIYTQNALITNIGGGGSAWTFPGSSPEFADPGTQWQGVTRKATTNISINNAGGGGAHNNMPPSVVAPLVFRII